MPRRRKKNTVNCVCCSEPLEKPYQLVFDKTGVELKLKQLLLDCFNLNITKDKNKVQAVCKDCSHDLIEAFDLQQKQAKDKSRNSEVTESIIDSIKLSGNQKDIEDDTVDVVDNGETEDDECFSESEYKTEMLEEANEIVETYEFYSGNDDNNIDIKIKEEIESETEIQDDDEPDFLGFNLECQESETFEQQNEPTTIKPTSEQINFREYKDKVLCSKFDDITFPNGIECRICNEILDSHVSILQHTEMKHCIEEFAYMCIIEDSCEPQKSYQDLCFHLVFKHYDLERLTIFAMCPHCGKRFSNYLLYNKHSCYLAKNAPRGKLDCDKCDKEFKSNKRYRFHLQFHLQSHRPMACLICDFMFVDEDEFFEHVKYSHEKELKFVCFQCDKKFTSQKNFNEHENLHKIVRKYKCDICSKAYMDKQMLMEHIQAHHSDCSPFQCNICGKYLNKKTLLNKHIMSHNMPEDKVVQYCSLCGLVPENEADGLKHIEKKHPEKKTDIQLDCCVIDKVYVCEYCEDAYKSTEELRIHRLRHSKKEFFCDMCPLVYNEYKRLKTHKLTHANYVDKRSTFPVMRHYMCDINDCTSSYLHWTSLGSHKRNKHNSNEVKSCPICFASFKNSLSCSFHMSKNHSESKYSCQFCEKIYNSKMALAVHVARKHNTTKIQCDECENTYSNNYDLRRHKNAVHQIFKCDICDKVMKNSKNLIVHKKMVHEKVKRFFCSICNKGYFNNCDRLQHESTVHSKLKKFKCNICPYAAIYKQSLNSHILLHFNEFPYKCTLCPKAFRRSYALTLHMKRHNNDREFKCPYEGCHSAYPIQGILNTHIKSKHANGQTGVSRRRRTIGNMSDSAKRKRLVTPRSTTFVDDDDGLDDGVIGNPPQRTDNEDELEDDLGDTVSQCYILEASPAVIVQRNKIDHDYIVRAEEEKIFENVIEEYEIDGTEIIQYTTDCIPAID